MIKAYVIRHRFKGRRLLYFWEERFLKVKTLFAGDLALKTAITIIVSVLLAFIVRDIFIVNFAGGAWKPGTGFGEYIDPSGSYFPSKTLWDWLDLLIVPIILSLGAYLFSRSERQNVQRIAKDKQREDLLQIYFDRMSDLLLIDDSKTSDRPNEVEVISRARTLAALSQLDGVRKGTLVKFIAEAGLISSSSPKISLKGADMNYADLRKSNLNGANFEEADLSFAVFDETLLYKVIFYQTNLEEASFISTYLEGSLFAGANLEKANFYRAQMTKACLSNSVLHRANLFGATLVQAEMDGAILKDANLSNAILKDADLSGANLQGANLEDTYLYGAKLHHVNLEKANLYNAQVTIDQLEKVAYLRGAIMPDGSVHD